MQVVVNNPGVIHVGVSRKLPQAGLNGVLPVDADPSQPKKWWCIDSGDARISVQAGDVLGVAFGQSDLPNLAFQKNGDVLSDFSVKKIGGLVYPCFSVDGGAEVEVVFAGSKFKQAPPPGFKPLMVVRSLI